MSSKPARITSLLNTRLIHRDWDGPGTHRNRNKILLGEVHQHNKALCKSLLSLSGLLGRGVFIKGPGGWPGSLHPTGLLHKEIRYRKQITHNRGRICPGEEASFNVDGKWENLCDKAELWTTSRRRSAHYPPLPAPGGRRGSSPSSLPSCCLRQRSGARKGRG